MSNICVVQECMRPASTKGLCPMHYMRMREHGTTDNPRPSVSARFWMKVHKGDGCWTWTAARDKNGYGFFRMNGKQCHAHRVAWILQNGQIRDGLWVLHKCDNPPCVNPSHLFLGTVLDNHHDMDSKHRRVITRGENNYLAKLTEVEARAIIRAEGTQQSIAEIFGVARTTVSRIKAGVRWPQLQEQAQHE